MIQRKMEGHPRVKVDCDHYRERSSPSAGKGPFPGPNASGERKTRVKMPPLNAYHRRLVHNALQSMEGIVTESKKGTAVTKRITIRKG